MPKAGRRKHIRLARQRAAAGPAAETTVNGGFCADVQAAPNGSGSAASPKAGKQKTVKSREDIVPMLEQVSSRSCARSLPIS
jgi:hypothetical protein